MLSAIKSALATIGRRLLGQVMATVSDKVPVERITGDTLIQMAQAIATTEMGATADGLTGDQKRRFAARIIEQILLASPLAFGKKLADPVKFRAAVEHLTGDFADILNSFDKDAVKTDDVA